MEHHQHHQQHDDDDQAHACAATTDGPDALDAVLMAAAAAPHAAASTAASAGLPASSATAPLAFASPSLFAVPSAFFSDPRPAARASASAVDGAAAAAAGGVDDGRVPAPSPAAALPSLFEIGGKGTAAAAGGGSVPVAGGGRAGGGSGSGGLLGGGLLSPCPLVSAAAGGMLGAAALLAPGSASGLPHGAGPGDSAGVGRRHHPAVVDALGVLAPLPLGHRLSLPPMGAGADDEEAAEAAVAGTGFWDEEEEDGEEEDEEGVVEGMGGGKLPAVAGTKRARAVTPIDGAAAVARGALDGGMEEDGEEEDENRAFQMMLPLAAAGAGGAGTDKENAGDGGNARQRGRVVGRGGVVSAGGRRHSTGSAGSGGERGGGGCKPAGGRRSMPAALPSSGGWHGALDPEFSSGPPVPEVGKKRVDWSKGEPAARMRAAIAECREITQHGSSSAGAKSWRGVARKYGISWAVLYPRLSGKIAVDAGLGGQRLEEGGGKSGGKSDGEGEGEGEGQGDDEGGAAGAGLSRDVEVKLFNACCSAARRGRGIDWDGLKSLAVKQAGGSKQFKPTAAWARGFHVRFPDLKRWRLEEEDGSCTFFLGREADAQGKGRRPVEVGVLTEDGAFPADSAAATGAGTAEAGAEPKEKKAAGASATGGRKPRAAALAALRVLEAAERDEDDHDRDEPSPQPNPHSPPPAAAAASGAMGRGCRNGRPSRKALLSGLDEDGGGGRRSSAGSVASDKGRKRRASGASASAASDVETGAAPVEAEAEGLADHDGAGSAEKRPRAAEAAATSTPTKQHRPGGSGLLQSLAVSTGVAALASPSPVRASPPSPPLSERSRRMRWAAEGPVWVLLRSQGFVADSADRRISLAAMKAFVGRFHLRLPKRSTAAAGPAHDDRAASPATQQRARRDDYMDFLRRLATLEAPVDGWTPAGLEAYGRRQQQEQQGQGQGQQQTQQAQPHLSSQDVATALLFSPAPAARPPAATQQPAQLTVQPPPLPLAFTLDAGALTTGPGTASTASFSPEASMTAASAAAAAAAGARAVAGHAGVRGRAPVGLTVELPRDGDDIVDGAETGMASYLSSLASPGFHAGPSPTALAAAAAMAAAVSSGPYGGAGGSSHDAADDFFASPSPR